MISTLQQRGPPTARRTAEYASHELSRPSRVPGLTIGPIPEAFRIRKPEQRRKPG
ncbi:hypothetical protein GCM10022252_38240 [Streptosporangium oxazolinicum]|uniref:Uncharacterized protein n=1 Tax=Streptosporangium oxazolinicum TaxID=909287 RepID=A0ABP8AZU4_9ACTN